MITGQYKKIFITVIIIGGILLWGAAQPVEATCICSGSSHNYSNIISQSACESICGGEGVATWSATPQGCESCPSNCLLDSDMPDFGSCAAEQSSQSGSSSLITPGCEMCPFSCVSDPETPGTGYCGGGSSEVPCVSCGNTTVSHILLNGEDVGCYTDANGDWCAVGTGKGGSSSGGSDSNSGSDSGSSGSKANVDKGNSDIFDRLGIKSPFTGGPGTVSLPPTGAKNMSEAILQILDFITTLAIPFAVLAVIWAGFLFVTAQGNEEKIGKARQNLLWTIIGVAVILSSKALVGYVSDLVVGGGGQVSSLFEKIRTTLNLAVELLFIMATVYFFWGVISYIKAAGDEKALKTGKQHMIWGIIGMAVMIGAWALVNIVANYIS